MAMNSDVDYFLARDPVINDISDKISYAVKKGGSQVSAQSFLANSQTASAISFNVTTPSENTVIDRNLLFRSTINFTVGIGSAATAAGYGVNTTAWKYGIDYALQAFPLNHLFSTINVACNNSSMNINLQDLLPAFLQMLDKEDLQRYSGTTPTYPDNYQNYDNAKLTTNNPLATYKGGDYNHWLPPRGSFPITITAVRRNDTAGGAVDVDNLRSGAATQYWEVDFAVTVTEPIFCGPLIFGDPKFSKAGLLGVNSLNLIFNIDSTAKRAISAVPTPSNAGPLTFRLRDANPFQNSELLMTFLSLDQTMSLPAKICTAIMDYPRYLSNTGNTLVSGDSGQVSINSLQLDRVPDKIVVFCRKSLAIQTVNDPDTFLPISKVNVTFANNTCLSNFTQQQLWKMSCRNGGKQSWIDFSGKGYFYADPGAADQSAAYVTANSFVPTVGSVLIIDPAYDLGLPPYISDGSLGSYQLQMSLTVENTYAVDFIPEICVCTFNSGVMTTIAGNSSLKSGLLNMATTMETIQRDNGKAVSMSGENDRLLGGMAGSAMSAGAMSGSARSAGKSGMARSAGKSVRGKLDMLSM